MLAATVRYAAFAALALAGPGLALQRLLRLPLDAALVLPLGLAATAGAYWLGLVTGWAWLGPLLLLGLDAALLMTLLRRRLADAPDAAGPGLRGALPVFAAIVALLALTQYPGNRRAAAGDFLLDAFLTADTAFHVGLSHELAAGYPPQVPGLAGQPIGYHLGTDLVRAAALRWAGVDPFDSIARFDVTLLALALLLALRGAAWTAGLRGSAVTIAGWTLLATDLSFVFAANPQAHWWADLLRGNIIIPLFVASPVVAGLAIVLGSLTALGRALDGGSRGWLVLAAALAGAAPFFRVFLGAHLLLGLGAAILLGRGDRARPLALTALPCALATLLLVTGQGGQPLQVGLAPLALVAETREALGLSPLAPMRLAAWAAFWIAASLGLRVLGLGAALRALAQGAPVARILSVMALAGWPLALAFRVAPAEVLAGQKPFNDAYVLIEQAGPLLWIFAAAPLARLGAGRWRVPVLAGAVLLAGPATAQFVAKKAALPHDPVPAAYVRAMDALRAHGRRGDVVLQRPGARYPPLPVVMAGRRVVYERFTSYSTQFAPGSELVRRHERVFRFFRTTDVEEARAIAREWGAQVVCLYGPDRVRFPAGALLVPIHEQAEARVYAIKAE